MVHLKTNVSLKLLKKQKLMS
ncbi:MAG: hypothetical protein ACKVLG_04245, partial [Fidelibacterota bacterium]